MDENTQAENTNAEVENSVTESPAVEQQATPEVTEEATKSEPISNEAEAQPETQSEPRKFTGASKRIHELVDKTKTLEQDNQSLAQRIEQLTGSQEPNQGNYPQMPVVQPGQEYSAEDYQRQVMQSADAIVQIRINQQRMFDRINKEASESITTYPELDPKNDAYNKELSEAVTEATEKAVRVDPNTSIKKFVDKLMKPYRNSVTKAVAENQETVARQVSEAAIRPSATTPPPAKSEDEKTWQEIEKEVGVVKYY